MISSEFAILGAKALFSKPLPVGQLYFPSWERYVSAMQGIFDRRYYTNQGPLAQKLELELQDYLGVKHVICVTNATIGLMMAAEALELKGKVILPSFTFIASAQSLSWTGIEPVFCDIDPATHQLDIDSLDAYLDNEVTAIMGINLWGGSCDPQALERYAFSRNLKLYFDSAHAFGCELGGKKLGCFGALEVFSFHATKILSATEGGCVTTNDDDIAARLRNIRSSYGAGPAVEVVKTSNGRMSEAQAAIALMSLEDFSKNQKNNERIYKKYIQGLEGVSGINVIEPQGVSFSNYQYVVCEVSQEDFGLSRDMLIQILEAENVLARRYFYPALHRTVQYQGKSKREINLPATDELCSSCMQLPIGGMVALSDVDKICELIRKIQAGSVKLFAKLSREG